MTATETTNSKNVAQECSDAMQTQRDKLIPVIQAFEIAFPDREFVIQPENRLVKNKDTGRIEAHLVSIKFAFKDN